VILALKNLGFDDYVKDMEELLVEHQKNVIYVLIKAKQDREKKSQKKKTDMTEDELLVLQQEIFAKSRERLNSGVNTLPTTE
jgi:hypothetical protein